MTPRQEYEVALAQVRKLGCTLPEDDERYRHSLKPHDVLFTVPHGAPGNDVVAAETALSAYEQSRARGLDAHILISACCRYMAKDTNRPEGRDSDFRAAVRDEIRQHRPRLLVDVHSFPDNYPHYHGRDIILIHTPDVTDLSFLRRYATLLRVAALRLGRPVVAEVQFQHQPVVHDLIREAMELGMPANSVMLAEHNESGSPTFYGLLHALAVVSFRS